VHDHGLRANDSVFASLGELPDTAQPPARHNAAHTNRPVEEALPFRVSVVQTEAELQRVQSLRQAAYGHHFPSMAASFGLADPVDRLEDVVIFYAEDKATGRMVGTARIHSNRSGPLQIEHCAALPSERQGQLLAEITRLAVIPGYAPPGRKEHITPASRSAQSLGRKVRPSWVMPWMKISLAVGEIIVE